MVARNSQYVRSELATKLTSLHAEQEERMAEHRASTMGLSYVNLFGYPIDVGAISVVPKDVAQKVGVILFYKKGRDVRLGVVNPDAKEVEKLVEKLTSQIGYEPRLFVMSHRSLKLSLSRYPKKTLREDLDTDEVLITREQLDEFEESISDLRALGERIGSVGPSEILHTVMAGALKMRASDIHIEPRRNEARLRYRIDGVLQDISVFGLDGWKQLLSRVKVLSDLKLNIHDTPQDGSFVTRVDGETYDIRTSVLPGGSGEYIVLRLLSRREQAFKLDELGMKERDIKVVERELKQSTGMILASGPTGSGKTTTIAACLGVVNRPELKIITLEDPIEYRVLGIEQTEVDRDAGYTFAVGLRSILRQDPDVIFVGEMRDAETVETSIHAAMTGHLVFSTIHANDAAGVILRLASMNMKSFVIAPALNLVIAQRLVRKICRKCAEEYQVDQKSRDHVAMVMEGLPKSVFNEAVLRDPKLTFLRARGCDECSQTGYMGRVGVFEVFAVRDEIEELILKGSDTGSIKEAAQKDGMTTIAQDAYLKVISKETTVEEVERISEE